MTSILDVKDVILLSKQILKNFIFKLVIFLCFFTNAYAYKFKIEYIISYINNKVEFLDPENLLVTNKKLIVIDRGLQKAILFTKKNRFLKSLKFYKKKYNFLIFGKNTETGDIVALVEDKRRNYYFIIFDKAFFIKSEKKILINRIRKDIKNALHIDASWYYFYPAALRYNPIIKKFILVNIDDSNIILFDEKGKYVGLKHIFYLGQPVTFRDLKIDANGNMFFLSKESGKVFVVDSKFDIVDVIGAPGGNYCQLALPFSLAISKNGNFIFIADYIKNTIIVYTRHKKCIMEFGTRGFYPGEFLGPYYIDMDKNNNLFVLEKYNRRIQVLKFLKK